MTRAVPTLLTVCPSFPSPARANDGQSIYIVEALRALSHLRGERMRVLALRIGDEPRVESGEFFEVERVEPSVPIPDVFALYEARCFPHALTPLARRAGELALELKRTRPVCGWVHGYESAPAALALRRAGARVVSVIHYLIADESVHSLSAGHDPVRTALLPGSVSRVSRLTPALLQEPLVRAASIGAPLARHLPWPPIIAMQLERLTQERRLLEASDRVVAVGRHFAATIARHYSWAEDRLRWCFAGAPAERARLPRTAPRHRHRLLMVGRPTPQKGWDYAAEALHLLEREHPQVAERLELEVIGGLTNWRGPTTDFGSAVLRRLEALRRVTFINRGRLPRDEVLAQYEAADAFVFPSVYEPFGLVVLEALAAGCPVITTDADGPADIVTPDAGWCVPFRDPTHRAQALAGAFERFARLPDMQLEAMSRAAHRALSRFSWRACAEAHLQFVAEASAQSV